MSNPSPVAVWSSLPVLVQVTVSPALTVTLPGLKLKSAIVTEPGPAATATGGGSSSGVVSCCSGAACCCCGWACGLGVVVGWAALTAESSDSAGSAAWSPLASTSAATAT